MYFHWSLVLFSHNRKPINYVVIGSSVSTTTEAATTTLSPALPDTTLFPDTTTTPSPYAAATFTETNNNTAYDYGQQTTTAQPYEYQYLTPATTTVANIVGYPTVPDVITTTTTPPVNLNPQVNVPSTNESTSNGEQSNPIQVDETSAKGSNDTSNTTENMYPPTVAPAITNLKVVPVTSQATVTMYVSKKKETSVGEANTSKTFIFVYA